MFKKLVFVTLIALSVDFFCGDKATDVILSVFKAVFNPVNTPLKRKNVLSKEELKLFNGVDKPQLYLAILGNIFDVSKGSKHYGLNGQYNFFIGQDASRSFVTGNFKSEDLSDDVADLSQEELRTINHWLNFYKKQYTKIGVLNGKYFNEYGEETPYGKTVKKLINEAELAKEKNELKKTIFPSCNVEWNADTGTRVWCSEKSGGIERDWIGVPRQLYEPETNNYRCVCINEKTKNLGTIKKYDGCDENSESCFVKTN